jgi:hypothetical protein
MDTFLENSSVDLWMLHLEKQVADMKSMFSKWFYEKEKKKHHHKGDDMYIEEEPDSKKKKELESLIKIEIEMGKCCHNRIQIPFHV